jgi:hypothetical protein
MSQDGVSIAFEVILEEMAVVESQLAVEGGQAFKSKRYDDATRLSESGKHLLAFREKLEKLKSEWTSGIDAETRKRVNVEPGYTIAPHTKGAKTNIKVTLANGKVIQNRKAADTFLQVIEFFGIEAVRGLSLTLNNAPLIDTKDSDKYRTSKSGRYYIMTHSNTQTKQELLQSIAKKLGMAINVVVA